MRCIKWVPSTFVYLMCVYIVHFIFFTNFYKFLQIIPTQPKIPKKGRRKRSTSAPTVDAPSSYAVVVKFWWMLYGFFLVISVPSLLSSLRSNKPFGSKGCRCSCERKKTKRGEKKKVHVKINGGKNKKSMKKRKYIFLIKQCNTHCHYLSFLLSR